MPHHIEKLENKIMSDASGNRVIIKPEIWSISDKLNEIIDFLNTLPAHKGESLQDNKKS